MDGTLGKGGGKQNIKEGLEMETRGRQLRGKPRKRCNDDLEKDIRLMGIRGWRKMAIE